ncbi:unnamed protein product [Cyclocybe aegerita]|uniref:Uncharacterized protein n=1 Tax=Cyclocybe aegerita TaxID=1973307 RepID=A0A8S0WTK9_CYCAE|nr:unnamed protein product [Cyclocybe aegerita]
MNSPPEAGSPSPSTPSSGSPPPEEATFQPNTGASYLSNLTSQITTAFGGSSSSKRRLPTGSSFGASSSSRDAKTRRKGEPGRSGGSNWPGELKETGGSKKEKDELIDNALVEYLRKEIGDPFLEPPLKG